MHKSNSQESVEYTLLANSLDFIWSAVEHLGGNTSPRELKYAVLHLCSGVELVLKSRLYQEDWRLVFQSVEKANEQAFETGNFRSVSFHEAIERLEKEYQVNLSDEQKQNLEKFRFKRNRLEHFKIVDTAGAITATSSYILSFLLDFINEELRQAEFSEDELGLLQNIREKLREFKVFTTERWKTIQEDVNGATTAVVICPSCWQKAAVIDNGIKCLFCGEKGQAGTSADSYILRVLGMNYYTVYKEGGEWPRYECPSCEQESLVKTFEGGGQFPEREYVCYTCGTSWEEGVLKRCTRCNQLYFPRSEDLGMCSDCFDSPVRADD